MGFIKSLRTNLAASRHQLASSGNDSRSKSCFDLDSQKSSSPTTPPRADRASRTSSMSQFSVVDEPADDDVVSPPPSSSILRGSSRRSIDYGSAPGGSSRGRGLKPSSLGGTARKSIDEPRPAPARRTSIDEPRPAPARRTSLDEPRPGQGSSRGNLRGSGQQSTSFKVTSNSDWYGPASSTPHLPSISNDHASSATSPNSHGEGQRGNPSFRGARHIRFGEEAPAETSTVGYGNSRKSLDMPRTVNTFTGEAMNTFTGESRSMSRKSIDMGHFSRNSIDDGRNGANPRASMSLNSAASFKSAPQNDNASNGTSNARSPGQDPRQRAARFEETMEKLFHIEGDYYKEEVGKMTRKEEEEQKQRDAEQEADRFATAQKELHENKVKRQEELWNKLRKEKAKLSMGGIAGLVMKMKGMKADAHDLVDKKHTGAAFMDLAAVDAAKSTIETEHKLEAVFTSFSQFGKWDPQQMVLPQHDVKGMGGLKFLSVCRRAGLVDDDCVTPRLIRDLFSVHKDTATSLISFQKFVVALTELSELNNWKGEEILQAVMDINAEGIMQIHAKDYDLAS